MNTINKLNRSSWPSTALALGLALVAGLLLLVVAVSSTQAQSAVSAAATTSYVPYRVQPGDSLSKIAAKYCTTWQEVYELNAGIIGTDPDVLEPGTLIYVPDRCSSTTPPASGVYDRGPSLHANGTVYGNVYTVAYGDTLYSVGQRFGVDWRVIAEANQLGPNPKIAAGQQLIIPGLGQAPPSALPPAIAITSPAPGTYLDAPYGTYGTGQGLPEGNVIVRLRDGSGNILAQQATVLQGDTVGIGGSGFWSVQFNGVYGQPNSNGSIEAFNPETGVSSSVSIWFTGR